MESNPAPIVVLLVLAVAVCLLVAALVFVLLRRRTRSPFVCPKCGFDLRGSIGPGAVTCPECGAVYE
jgi:hypothetical protein